MDIQVPHFESNVAAQSPSSARRPGLIKRSGAKLKSKSKSNKAVRVTVKSVRPAERKRIVKYLAVCRDPKAYQAVVKAAPSSVIKTICDAALNVQRGERVVLNRPQKTLFRRHRTAVATLASKAVPVARKRKILTQRGGAFFIPALIGAALTGLGSALFGGR